MVGIRAGLSKNLCHSQRQFRANRFVLPSVENPVAQPRTTARHLSTSTFDSFHACAKRKIAIGTWEDVEQAFLQKRLPGSLKSALKVLGFKANGNAARYWNVDLFLTTKQETLLPNNTSRFVLAVN